jgi:hypothetical protein
MKREGGFRGLRGQTRRRYGGEREKNFFCVLLMGNEN